MRRVRFRIRTNMIAIAALAVQMGFGVARRIDQRTDIQVKHLTSFSNRNVLTMPPQTSPRAWHRHFRLSLRSLMIAVLLLGGGLAWIVRSAQVQRAAVAGIRTEWAMIYYDWQCKDG